MSRARILVIDAEMGSVIMHSDGLHMHPPQVATKERRYTSARFPLI